MLKWKEDRRPPRLGWAPGGYLCRCVGKCGVQFLGEKRATTCADCAYAVPDDKMPLEWRINKVVEKPEMFVIGDVIGLLEDLKAALQMGKTEAIVLLERQNSALRARADELLEANTRFTSRARAAEDALKAAGLPIPEPKEN